VPRVNNLTTFMCSFSSNLEAPGPVQASVRIYFTYLINVRKMEDTKPILILTLLNQSRAMSETAPT